MPPRSQGGAFDQAPFIVFWETTQACDLVCRHCRADARPARDPGELSFDEGTRLLDEIRAMGCPLVVLTGGDPAKRPDLVAHVRHGTAIGLRVALTPSATTLVTPALLAALADGGLARLAVSLDGATAATHDGFRGEICPSGFLPLPCGSVRHDSLAEVYRRHPVFMALRNPDLLGGKCGACEFRRVCSGSRARAFAMTGDMFAAEPACAYEPRAHASAP